jgi:hypothetical protein
LRQKRTLAGAFGGEFESGGGEAELFRVHTTFLRRDWMTGFCRFSLNGYVIIRKTHPLSGNRYFNVRLVESHNIWKINHD